MRNKRLDLLRGVAVLLVLFHHGDIHNLLQKSGWVGVDLFFVLSGFLISGLLFAEYRKRKSIDFMRFFIRRGLKIYPSFYIFLAATFLLQFRFHTTRPAQDYLRELLYVQNYGSSAWEHTWSLAVEEHFYILLPIFLFALIRFSRDRGDRFRGIPLSFLLIAVGCLTLRSAAAWGAHSEALAEWPTPKRFYAPTQLRIDSLFFGVLLGYLHHHRPAFLERLLLPARNRIAMAALSTALISYCVFFSAGTRVIVSFGFTLLYLGFGLLLLLCLHVHNILPARLGGLLAPVGSIFASIGAYSYSIYLWHLAVQAWAPALVSRIIHVQLDPRARFLIYFVGSIGVGIFMSRLVEYPILRIRDRFYPATRTVESGVTLLSLDTPREHLARPLPSGDNLTR